MSDNKVTITFRHVLPIVNNWGTKRLHEEMAKVQRNPDFAQLAVLAQSAEQQTEANIQAALKMLGR